MDRSKTTKAFYLKEMLNYLNIDGHEFAGLVGVDYRTVLRWLAQYRPPQRVICIIEAWRTLHDYGLAFKPNSINIRITKDGVKELTPMTKTENLT